MVSILGGGVQGVGDSTKPAGPAAKNESQSRCAQPVLWLCEVMLGLKMQSTLRTVVDCAIMGPVQWLAAKLE